MAKRFIILVCTCWNTDSLVDKNLHYVGFCRQGNLCVDMLFKPRCCDMSTCIVALLNTWWRHQMETFSTLLAFCAGNSPVHGEFPAQRPVTQSFDVFIDLRLNKRLSKQSRGWWFETLSCPLWRQCNEGNLCVKVSLTHWGRDKMAAIFQMTCSNAFSWMKIYEFCLRFHWSLLLRFKLVTFQHWFG